MARIETAYLYVVGMPDGPNKIGYAQSPPARLKAIVREERNDKIVLVQMFAINARWALSAERYAHWLLRDRHFRHEWFNVSRAEAVAAAKAAVAIDYAQMDRNFIPPIVPRGRPPKKNVQARK